MPDGSSHGDGVLRLFVAIGDGALWLFNCLIWLNGALKFKSIYVFGKGGFAKGWNGSFACVPVKEKRF